MHEAVRATPGPLTGYRALDLTDEKGLLCGKILADLGVDVIKVERPGGDAARRIGPFAQDIPDPERSLFWWAFNANKRGITLDLTKPEGRELFFCLIRTADFVIESFPPGELDRRGLGYHTLARHRPRLILTSITPFGQTGPYARYKATDLVLMAMGGSMFVMGDPDRPPVRIGYPQAFLHAGAEAAVGSLIAHYHRELTGEGQWVDVSAQEAVVWTLMNETPFPILHGVSVKREGLYTSTAGLRRQRIYACKDGYISFHMVGGAMGGPSFRALTAWMEEEGMAPALMRDKDWDGWDLSTLAADPERGQQELDAIAAAMARFFSRFTKQELYSQALKRRILLAPVADIGDIMASEQLAAREFFVRMSPGAVADGSPLGTSEALYPGPFAKFSATPIRLHRWAPRIGEHNTEIYAGELGLSDTALQALRSEGVI
jgi:crotonobetainyl-CoA:carnitine CoA-transferase CaiB-like acyl-CoA transferase